MMMGVQFTSQVSMPVNKLNRLEAHCSQTEFWALVQVAREFGAHVFGTGQAAQLDP
jgi:hypothetical protein